MTEQEMLEKAIEEMESDICNGCKYYKGKDVCCICDVTSFAKTLVDLHYRKEEEVRKQLVIKIWNAMKRFGSIADEGRYIDCISVDEFKNYLKENFGVGVEE